MTALALVGLFALLRQHPAPDTFGITGQQFWRTAFGSSPWYPLAGDADGDGLADLIALGPLTDTNIEVARTDPLGKPNPGARVHFSIGHDVIAAGTGSFLRTAPAKDVLTVFADGTIRLASQGISDGKLYQRIEDVGKIEPNEIPHAPIRTAVADFDADGHQDALLLDKDGRLVILYNRPQNPKLATSPANPARFIAKPLKTTLADIRQFAAGNWNGKGQAVYLDKDGNVWAAPILKDDLAKPRLVATHSPDDHMVVGRFRGLPDADILVGQRLYTGAKYLTLKDLPDTEAAKSDGVWDVADIDGNGKDDLIRHHEGRERWGAQDIYVHFSYDATDSKRGYYCSSNDGLPDFWKMGLVKPGGLDLKALGCKVGHRDLVIEVERFENVNFDELKAHMARAAQYFASIPLKNPDGTTGIALHFLYPDPWPVADHDKIMGDFDGHFPRHEHRGIVHTMFSENAGPLVSAINADRGHFNGHWQEFVHELGHQIDLAHDGFYGSPSYNSDTGCALYPSLMSYSYSYGLDGSGDNVQYSDGARASLVLNELHLNEKLPFPMATVHFLAEGPYRFKLKPGPDGQSTLVDWNWNGIFGEEDVVGDLNYTHGTDPGPLLGVGRTTAAPTVVLHGDRPLLIYVQGGMLSVRTWLGSNWSDETSDRNAGATGDPSAAYLNGKTYVVYPTDKGAVLRAITMDDPAHPKLEEPNLLPRTSGAQPTLVTAEKRLALLLWRGKTAPIDLAIFKLSSNGLAMGQIHSLDIRSDAPVGAATGATGPEGVDLWIGRVQSDGLDHPGQTEIVRYRLGELGGERLIARQWVAGVWARRRMALLWRSELGFSPDGRLYIVGSGINGSGENKEQFISMAVPYPDMGGWLIRRYEQPSFQSPSCAGACFYQNNILYALRYGNDELHVSFYGGGWTPWPTGDFDDIGHIRDYGLSHSIPVIPR